MVDSNLVEQIKSELNEDLYNRYDGEYDVWSEVVVDCPSSELEDLLGQIPEGEEEEYYEEHIYPYIRSLEDE